MSEGGEGRWLEGVMGRTTVWHCQLLYREAALPSMRIHEGGYFLIPRGSSGTRQNLHPQMHVLYIWVADTIDLFCYY